METTLEDVEKFLDKEGPDEETEFTAALDQALELSDEPDEEPQGPNQPQETAETAKTSATSPLEAAILDTLNRLQERWKARQARSAAILKAAEKYAEQGCSVIPVEEGSKKPLDFWKEYQDRRPTDKELKEWFTDTGYQIGMVTGCVSGGLFILDFDGENWQEIFKEFMNRFPEFLDSLVVRTGSGKVHIYGICPDMPKDLTRKVKKYFDPEGKIIGEVELRANSHQALCPPSLHPCGEQYSFVDDTKSPVSVSLEKLNEILAWMNEGQKVNPAPDTQNDDLPPEIELTPTQRRSLAKFYVSRLAGQCRRGANRNDKGYELARSLNDIGMPVEEAEEFMKRFQSLVPQAKLKGGTEDRYTIEEAIASLESAYKNPRGKPWIPYGFFKIDPETGKYLEEGEVTEPTIELLLSCPLTEAGNAESFEAIYDDQFCFIKEMKKWYRWDGVRWDEELDEAKMKMLEVMRTRARCADNIEDEKFMDAFKNWCKSSESDYRLKASLNIASSMLAKSFNDFNTDPYLLACRNGVVDLRTGLFRQAIAEDRLLKTNWVEYNPEAQCPRWLQFLDEIFKGNRKVIDYIQRTVGYTLTGDIKEQCFFVLYGTGANGKSVFLSTILQLMGEYGQSAPSSTFNEMGSCGNATPEIARLANIRFVKSVEMKEQSRFNVERIKYLTGGDRIVARGLYKEPIEFEPTHKIWLAINHKPIIDEDSEAIWRRIHLIPFNVHFIEPEKAHKGDLVQDRRLPEVLKSELSGILNWAIQGCLIWQQDGLQPPEEVQMATEIYRKESDVVGRFLEQETEKEEGAEVRASDLYGAYKTWCDSEGEKPVNQTNFGRRLTERGYVKKPKPYVTYQGLTLVNLSLLKPDERSERLREIFRKNKECSESQISS